MVTKAQMRATAKYEKNNYDDVRLRVKKGQRDQIKAYAEKNGESLNSYINRLISEDMAAHGQSLPRLVLPAQSQNPKQRVNFSGKPPQEIF